MRKLIGTTVLGGLLFLVPLVLVVVLLGKAFDILKTVAKPLSKSLPYEYFGSMAPVVVITILLMFVLSFIVGLFARSKKGRLLQSKVEAVLLNVLPGYAWVKGMTGDIRDDEAEELLKPVVIKFDEMWQIAFEVDRMENGMVTVYLPAAPNAREGSVAFVEPERVEAISAGLQAVVKSYKMLGRGSAEMFLDKRTAS